MTISGFSMVKNAGKLYYPIRQVIQSILPMVDEFVVALGDCDTDDTTRQEILSLQSDKIKIIDTVWDNQKYTRGTIYAQQTDVAKSYCSGDWLFYVQSDEAVHEKDLHMIRKNCQNYKNDSRIEGFLFNYYHFWGDYGHFQNSHTWYRKEIRIIRNDPDIHSWGDAQSFRRIPGFDGLNYRQQENTFKLNVIGLDAHFYHYGWVRPPDLMASKIKTFTGHQRDRSTFDRMIRNKEFNSTYDYGPLNRVPRFKGTHPAVMKEWIARFDWLDQLRLRGRISTNSPRSKQDRLKYRIISFIEKKMLFGLRLGEFKNYILVK